MSRKPPAKKPRAGGGLKPGLAVLGTMLLWAALNEPASFDPISIVLWSLSACTLGLLAAAALLLAAPLARVGLLLMARLRSGLNGPAEDA